MPFNSNNSRHLYFFQFPAIVFDTCALIWFAKKTNGLSLLNSVMSTYRILIPTTVLYELAFGLSGMSTPEESEIRDLFFKRKNEIDMLNYSFARQRELLQPGGFSVINPTYNEWWTARDRILKYSELSGASVGKNKKELSMDALIHACARNCFAPICTNNVEDFLKLNKAADALTHDGGVPIFSPQQVLDSLTCEIFFEE